MTYDDIPALLRDPEAKTLLNKPLFDFDSPAILQAAWRGDRRTIEALLQVGADINRKSSWWASGFGVLDMDDSELAAWLIERGVGLQASAKKYRVIMLNSRFPAIAVASNTLKQSLTEQPRTRNGGSLSGNFDHQRVLHLCLVFSPYARAFRTVAWFIHVALCRTLDCSEFSIRRQDHEASDYLNSKYFFSSASSEMFHFSKKAS